MSHIDKKGTTVKPTEHNMKFVFTRENGFFVLLCAFLHVGGTGAPSRAPRLLAGAVSLCALIGALAFTAAPALAAGPEAPEALKPEPIKATEATLQGIVNPKISAETEPGTYQFLYKATKKDTTAECESAGASKAPASPGMYFGLGPEPASEPVTGLTEGTEYIVCLAATTAGGTSVGPPYPFKTGLKLETPVNAKVKAGSITATSVEVEGELNPGKERKTDQGYFEIIYKVSALSAPPTGECEENATHYQSTSGVKEEKVAEKLTSLEPNAKYTFCLRVGNEDGETAIGAPVTFTTPPAPPAIESESVSLPVKATEAHLEAIVNPNNEATECHFEYEVEEPLLASPATALCEPASFPASFGGQHVGLITSDFGALEPDETYYYRVVAKSGAGETKGTAVEPVKHFQTALLPETPAILKPESITATEATLHGALNPGVDRTREPGTYEFRYRQSATECQGAEEKAADAPSPPGLKQNEPAQATVTGLLPDTTYTFCLLAGNEAGETSSPSAPETFTTLTQPPTVTQTESAEVGTNEATVSAKIDPGGEAATYYVEYGTGEPYAKSKEASLAASPVAVGVRVKLSELDASTEYHYRFVAKRGAETVPGEEKTFTTLASTTVKPLTLPDHRAYELVSAPEDTEVATPNRPYGGEEEFYAFPHQYRAANNGNAVAYSGQTPASGVGGTGSGVDQYIVTRGTKGWEGGDISHPYRLEPENHGGGETDFEGFSDDLTVQTAVSDSSSLAPEPEPAPGCNGSEGEHNTPYSRTASGYHALITSGQGGCFAAGNAGISADDSHILLYSAEALTPQAKEGANFAEDENLYDSAGGQLHQDNVLPDGESEQNPHATFGSRAIFVGDVSNDGARVFWTDLNTEVTPEDPTGAARLFVRENDAEPQSPIGPKGECTVAGDACTVQVDAAQGGPGAGGGGQFWAASGEGSKVFFTDESQLTAESTAVSGEADLYEYEVGEAGGPGKLTDLTVAKSGHADVTDVVGASEESSYDGSYVYFFASGVLTQGPNAEGREPVAGQSNLYMSHDGVATFIVTGADVSIKTGPNEELSSVEMAAGGHAVGFLSSLPLTGYGNNGVPELFVYEADEGRIFCASCNPSGAAPIELSAGGGNALWENTHMVWLGSSETPMFNLRWINEAGTQVYFVTNQALVPQDTNGVDDVYEWEGDGSGGCVQAAGCVTPLSSVVTQFPAYFADSSASGDDVFFTQRASLVPSAVDEDVKLYDARVGGGFPETSLSCTGTGCQGGPPAPPIFATPASVTFEGVGDFPGGRAPNPPVIKPPAKKKAVKCPKGKTRNKRHKCVTKKKAKKAKKSTHHKGSK